MGRRSSGVTAGDRNTHKHRNSELCHGAAMRISSPSVSQRPPASPSVPQRLPAVDACVTESHGCPTPPKPPKETRWRHGEFGADPLSTTSLTVHARPDSLCKGSSRTALWRQQQLQLSGYSVALHHRLGGALCSPWSEGSGVQRGAIPSSGWSAVFPVERGFGGTAWRYTIVWVERCVPRGARVQGGDFVCSAAGLGCEKEAARADPVQAVPKWFVLLVAGKLHHNAPA
ncbi:unnamed protein product [Lota lota]